MIQANDSSGQPRTDKRIIIRYEEPTQDCLHPKLIVTDTGTGMDGWLIEQYFLKVGRSFYKSAEFKRERIQLRKQALDFAPISEFGIGFLSSFLLSDRVIVETAMWDAIRGDTQKRTLVIDGPSRLIRLEKHANEGVRRFRGTQITLFLVRGGSKKEKEEQPPTWDQVKRYLDEVCQDLPYDLELEYVSNDGNVTHSKIKPRGLTVELPSYLEEMALRIPVNDSDFGIEGEIVLINLLRLKEMKDKAPDIEILSDRDQPRFPERNASTLLRGGFKIGDVPGLPETYLLSYSNTPGTARLRLTWEKRRELRYLSPNLARNSVSDKEAIAKHVERLWLSYLLEHIDDLPKGQLYNIHFGARYYYPRNTDKLLEWLEEEYDAFDIYQLAKQEWNRKFSKKRIVEWEEGNGSALAFGNDDSLSYELLERILPYVSGLQVREKGVYVNPPNPNISALTAWKSFISKPVRWLFADFIGTIEDLLYYYNYQSLSYNMPALNNCFRERLREFSEDECQRLSIVLSGILIGRAQKEEVYLQQNEMALALRAQSVAGDLEIGLRTTSGIKSWRLDSFSFSLSDAADDSL